ncbi:MAG: hypothetical protein WDW38_007849 [Sanguina aurantia]
MYDINCPTAPRSPRRRILRTYQPCLKDSVGKIAIMDAAADTHTEEELLAHFGRTPTVICAGPQWDPSQPSFYKCPAPLELLRRLGDSALIFWNGGGNFGDVWRDIQLYRPRGLTYKFTDWPTGLDVMTNRPQEMYTELAATRWHLGLRMASEGGMLITNRLHATRPPRPWLQQTGGTMRLARSSSAACTEEALQSWHAVADTELEELAAAMQMAVELHLERSSREPE